MCFFYNWDIHIMAFLKVFESALVKPTRCVKSIRYTDVFKKIVESLYASVVSAF